MSRNGLGLGLGLGLRLGLGLFLGITTYTASLHANKDSRKSTHVLLKKF